MVSDEEAREVVEVMSLVGLVDDMWSKVALSVEEITWGKGYDADNVCSFGGATRELSYQFWHFGLKSVAVADST